MMELRQSAVFRKWWTSLRDRSARGAIASRLDRLTQGHEGDAKDVGHGIRELRIHHGPGYRIYFQRRGAAIILLLCAGDKGSQPRDIALARRLADEWEDDDE